MSVRSSVSLWSKLGNLLYILYANNIMQNFKLAKIEIYVNDFSAYGVLNIDNGKCELQINLIIFKNNKKWQFNINFEQYHTIHFGKKITF